MTDWQRMATDLIGRLDGRIHLRIIMQPAMATFYANRDGSRDAREDGPPYFWVIFTDRTHAKELLEVGFKAVAKILAFALLLDAIYQFIALHWFYPGEDVLVALILAFVPYRLIRGPANRIAWWRASRQSSLRPRSGASR